MQAMNKRQLIDEILSINRSAHPGFLAEFTESDLREYLGKLTTLVTPGSALPAGMDGPGESGQYVPCSAPLFESLA